MHFSSPVYSLRTQHELRMRQKSLPLMGQKRTPYLGSCDIPRRFAKGNLSIKPSEPRPSRSHNTLVPLFGDFWMLSRGFPGLAMNVKDKKMFMGLGTYINPCKDAHTAEWRINTHLDHPTIIAHILVAVQWPYNCGQSTFIFSLRAVCATAIHHNFHKYLP